MAFENGDIRKHLSKQTDCKSIYSFNSVVNNSIKLWRGLEKMPFGKVTDIYTPVFLENFKKMCTLSLGKS